MKLLGVDFGSKRVGIAVADTEAGMAFPKTVLENNRDFFANFKKIVEDEKIEKIVLGESKDFKGKDNAIMTLITDFKARIEQELSLKVEMIPEFLSSSQALRLQEETTMLDASSAAIILQSFLDKQKNNE